MNHRRTAAVLATLVAGAATALIMAPAAQAHPLGNFTVNQYDGLVVAPGTLRVDHVEDLAEIPAAQERRRIDTDGDDRLSEAELSAWARARCDRAAAGAGLTVGGDGAAGTAGAAEAVSAERASARERPGQAGLRTLRVTCALTAPLPDEGDIRVEFRPADATNGTGWREITARGDRMTLDGADVPRDSLSRRLTAYPEDLLSSPADDRSAAFSAEPGGPALAGSSGASDTSASSGDGSGSPVAGVLPRGADRWAQALTALVARHELSFGFALLALGASLVLGAGHALAPGHGKTMMAAAATAGGRSSLRDVLALGASVTLTHTLGVFALGGLIVAGSAAAPTVVSWLGIASGGLVAAAGVLLVRKAWRGRHHAHGHTHAHDHGHGHPHTHTHAHMEERVPVAVAVSGPGPSGPGASGGLADAKAHDHPHPPTHSHDHAHPHTHSHTPPAPGLRGVILMGLAGGLVPSPSAVVVLVGAAALGQAWFGFLLVLAYGAGLALTLTAAGFAVVRLRETTTRRLARRPGGRLAGLVHRAAPLASATVVLALGCGLLLRGAATVLG